MTDIVELNQLIKQDNQVYRLPMEASEKFEYSDGESVECYLYQVLSKSSDLGSRSETLQDKIIDWPSEYHLSSDRANILRCFDLSCVKNALEFGSGCGAISRYLGEQGIQVDAIEGSSIRASLGKMRCTDLDHVCVVNANYNDIQIPDKYYDLVLFIGVIEYARKFHPQARSDREAVVAILRQAATYLKEGGVIIIAIENRLGLKYILGQHEDHYAKRYVGIHKYPNSAGIATYSKSEWLEILKEAGISTCAFNYPFPDYKIPRVCLGDDYVEQDPYAFNHLEGLFSRDYTRPVRKSPTESIAWEAASQGKFLDTIANSFCLVAGNDTTIVDKVSGFDFCHMPGPNRKNAFAVVTRKPKGRDIVEKTRVSKTQNNQLPELKQILEDQPYLHGNLLNTEWLRSILIYTRREEFDIQLAQYFQYIEKLETDGVPLTIDLLPINIIVQEDGTYHGFDQEWEVDWAISKEYLLFRALLTFVVTNWTHMKDFLEWLELSTVQDFVDYGFRNHNLILSRYIDEFIARENHFQQLTTNTTDNRRVEGLLETRFDFSAGDREIYAALLWAEQEGQFDDSKKIELTYTPDPDSQCLVFELPQTATRISAIRLDPFDIRKSDNIGFFSLSNISLIEKLPDSETLLWSITGEKNIAAHSNLESAQFEPLADTGYWIASTNFPKIDISPGQIFERNPSGQFVVKVSLRVCESIEYILAHHRYPSMARQSALLETDLKKTLRHLDSARAEIAQIKAGKPFRFGMKVFSWLKFLKP